MPNRHLPLEPSARVLLDAVIAMSSDLDLRSVLHRITRSACELTGATYGAIGVVGDDGRFADLVTHGIDADRAARIIDRVARRGPPGFPSGHQRTRLFLGVPVRIQDRIFGNLYLSKKSLRGEPFTDEDEMLVNALANAAGYVIDNARAYGRSERGRVWLQAAADLTAALQPPLAHEIALDRTAHTVLPLTRAHAVVAGTIAPGSAVAAIAPHDLDDDARVRRALRQLTDILPAGFVEPIVFQIDGFHILAVALGSALTGRGAIAAFYDDAGSLPDPDERDLFAGLGRQAGLALDRVQAVDDRANLAVVTDRERIARDLHDVVIQRLFATGLQLQALGQLSDDPVLAERISAAVDALDLTIKDVRGTIFELHHAHSGSLRAELRAVVREYVSGLGFIPVLRTTGPVDTAIPAHVRAQLLPVLREAVSNVARHAQATSTEIELAVTEDELVLVVRDDGVGPSDELNESGLSNARRRADRLGGSFAITQRRPRGTSFTWRVPLAGPG